MSENIAKLTTEQRLAFRRIINRLRIETDALQGNFTAIIRGSDDVCADDLLAIVRSIMQAAVDCDLLVKVAGKVPFGELAN